MICHAVDGPPHKIIQSSNHDWTKLFLTPQLSPTISSYRWTVIGVWLFSSVSSFMVLNTLGILLPAISAELSLSPSQQGLLGSASHWGNIALAIPLSWATSRLSPKWLTSGTLILATLCLFVQSWAPVFIVLLMGRLLFGISNIAQAPARALLTRQWFLPGEVIIVNGLSNVLFGLVVGGGLALAPVILELLDGDWRMTLRIFGLFFAGITALWMVVGKTRTNESDRDIVVPQGLEVVKGALGHRDLWIGGLGFVGATMSFGAFLAFYPTLMLEEYGISLRLSGGILAAGVILGGVGGLAIGWAASTTGREKNFLQVLGVLMLGSNLGMILTGSVPALFVFSLLNGVAWAFFPILVTVPFHLPGIRPRELAVAFTFTMMMTSVGTSLGPLFTGFLQEAFDDLKPALFIISFGSVSLILAGSKLRFGAQRLTAEI
ncbi:MAG TPA: MFS transporter [Dehalococcoidia bacterium]|nr:MFS transporter [Dehalococcoidia bacterium]